MTDALATYGMDVVSWVLAALGALLSAYVWTLLRTGYARDALQRAWIEIQGAVTEVSQTYVDEIRRGRSDGVLTEEERSAARRRAVAIAKENLGRKGLARLARVLGMDAHNWIVSKTEQAVRLAKDSTKGAP